MTDQKREAKVRLDECPIGLFWAGDDLCVKTEYMNNDGRVLAYIVESGEFFCGSQPQTVENQLAQMVEPVGIDFACYRLDGNLDVLCEALARSLKNVMDLPRGDVNLGFLGGTHLSTASRALARYEQFREARA